MIDPQLLQAGSESTGDIVNVRDDFSHDVQLVSADAGFFDGNTEFGLSLIDFGAV